MTPLRIFISSVQKEFAEERAALREYLRGDVLVRRRFATSADLVAGAGIQGKRWVRDHHSAPRRGSYRGSRACDAGAPGRDEAR